MTDLGHMQYEACQLSWADLPSVESYNSMDVLTKFKSTLPSMQSASTWLLPKLVLSRLCVGLSWLRQHRHSQGDSVCPVSTCAEPMEGAMPQSGLQVLPSEILHRREQDTQSELGTQNWLPRVA